MLAKVRCRIRFHFQREWKIFPQGDVEPFVRMVNSSSEANDSRLRAASCVAAMLIAYGSGHALGWFMLIATIISIGDAAIVLQQGGRRAVAFGVHGGTAAAMVIISGLLLFD